MGSLERYNGNDDHPLTRLRHELDRSFQRLFDDPTFFGEGLGGRTFLPALNVEEKADRYVIQAEMPGMEEDDIDIEVQGNTLTIRGERREERREGESLPPDGEPLRYLSTILYVARKRRCRKDYGRKQEWGPLCGCAEGSVERSKENPNQQAESINGWEAYTAIRKELRFLLYILFLLIID